MARDGAGNGVCASQDCDFALASVDSETCQGGDGGCGATCVFRRLQAYAVVIYRCGQACKTAADQGRYEEWHDREPRYYGNHEYGHNDPLHHG